MRVLGIDCGSETTGYGVVEESADRRLTCHATGAIQLKTGSPMAAKLQKIFTELTVIIAEHRPEIVAIEDVFYAVNVKTALKLGQVRGVAMLAASFAGCQWRSTRRYRLNPPWSAMAVRRSTRCSRWLPGFCILPRRPNPRTLLTRWPSPSATFTRPPPPSAMRRRPMKRRAFFLFCTAFLAALVLCAQNADQNPTIPHHHI